MNHVVVPVRQPLATLGSLFLLLVGSNRNPGDEHFPEEKHDDDAVTRILNGTTLGLIRINRILPFGTSSYLVRTAPNREPNLGASAYNNVVTHTS
jgi:hypothetical protein